METPKNIMRLKPYTLTELGYLYHADHRTVRKWIALFQEELGVKVGRYYTVNQMRIIFDNIGYPADIEIPSTCF